MTIMDHHHLAMELADKADRAKRNGRHDVAKQIFAEAFGYERAAAMKLEARVAIEPTRSVLFRSAASLALEAGLLRNAEQMIAYGLMGSPPEEIAEELRDLLERANFERHLSLRGIVLLSTELQMSMSGEEVGFGLVRIAEFRERIEKLEALAFRTVERTLDRPYRESGRRRTTSPELVPYISVPRAASFAVTVRFGGEQQSLPGMELGSKVVTEIMDCLELLDAGRLDELGARIPQEAYFRNFVSLASRIAPDGERISQVGFTAYGQNAERRVRLRQRRSDWNIGPESRQTSDAQVVELRGELRKADATRSQYGQIQIISNDNMKYTVKVPLGMMADIVRPLFECEVVVAAVMAGRDRYELRDIRAVDAD